ncbi:MAG: hypothetical protein QOH39_205 [Verrucomicrobiota bacterium]|jgi:hypothetical protein
MTPLVVGNANVSKDLQLLHANALAGGAFHSEEVARPGYFATSCRFHAPETRRDRHHEQTPANTKAR